MSTIKDETATAIDELRLTNRNVKAADDMALVRGYAEAYGRLKSAIEYAADWLEGRQPMMSRAEVASRLRGALERAETVRNGGTVSCN